MKAHSTSFRVYYEDTDAGGIVYHSNYLKFAERGRCEMLRSFDLECSSIEEKLGMMFVLKHADIEYIKPAMLDDLLEVQTMVSSMRNTSFQMRQIVHKNGAEICSMLITLVCVDTKTIKPVRLPEILRDQFEPYLITPKD